MRSSRQPYTIHLLKTVLPHLGPAMLYLAVGIVLVVATVKAPSLGVIAAAVAIVRALQGRAPEPGEVRLAPDSSEKALQDTLLPPRSGDR